MIKNSLISYRWSTGYVVGKEPYDGNNQYGLYQPDCSRFHDITEQYSGSQAYDSDFNKKFALYGGTHRSFAAGFKNDNV